MHCSTRSPFTRTLLFSCTLFVVAIQDITGTFTSSVSESRCGILTPDPRHFAEIPWTDSTLNEEDPKIVIAATDTTLVVAKISPAERRNLRSVNNVEQSTVLAELDVPLEQRSGEPAHGQISVFEWEGSLTTAGKWVFHSTVVLPHWRGYRECGASLALQDDNLLVGCPFENGGRGAVYAFLRNSEGTWEFGARLSEEDDTPTGSHFGSSIALQDHIAIVGAPGSPKGAAYAIYQDENDPTVWQTGFTFQPIPNEPWTGFGESVALHVGEHTFVAVGAPHANGLRGAVSVFVQNPSDSRGVWAGQAHLEYQGGEAGDLLGSSVAVNSNTIVAGAPQYSSPSGASPRSGAVFIFVRQEGSRSIFWELNRRLAPEDLTIDAQFGQTVAMTGDNVIIVGAAQVDESRGAVYVYRKQESSNGIVSESEVFVNSPPYWRHDAKVVAMNRESGDRFGQVVSGSERMLFGSSPGMNGVYSFPNEKCSDASGGESGKKLDLYIILDKSGSIEWYKRQCKNVQDGFSIGRHPGGSQTDSPVAGFSCWELLVNFIENLIHMIQEKNPHLKWETGNLRVHISAFSCAARQRYPVTYEYLDLKDSATSFAAAILAMLEDDSHRGGTCPGQALEYVLSKVEMAKAKDISQGVPSEDRVTAGVIVTDGLVYGDKRIRTASNALAERGMEMYGVAIFGGKVTARNYRRLVRQAEKITMITNGVQRAYQLGSFALTQVAQDIASSVGLKTVTPSPTFAPTSTPTAAPSLPVIFMAKGIPARTLESKSRQLVKNLQKIGGGPLRDVFGEELRWNSRQLGGEFGDDDDVDIEEVQNVWCGYGRRSDRPPRYVRRYLKRRMNSFWLSDPSEVFEDICNDEIHRDHCRWNSVRVSCEPLQETLRPTAAPTEKVVDGSGNGFPTASPTSSPEIEPKFDCSTLTSESECKQYNSLCFWHWNKKSCFRGPLN